MPVLSLSNCLNSNLIKVSCCESNFSIIGDCGVSLITVSDKDSLNLF
jgi:hypothetical protein